MSNTKMKASPLWMIMVKDIRMLEHDANSQYKFNRFWAIVWGFSMLVMLIPLWPHSLQQFTSLLILEVSLWANFATHFGAMSSALAAKNTTQTLVDTSGVVEDISGDITDIHHTTNQLDNLLFPLVTDTTPLDHQEVQL